MLSPTKTDVLDDNNGARSQSTSTDTRLADLPYHYNLTLKELFEAADLNIAIIQQSTISEEDELLRDRLDKLESLLESLSSKFWNLGDVPDRVMYLLLLIFQKFYEATVRYINKERVFIITDLGEGIAASDSLLLQLLPHGQIHVSLEKLVASLDVSEDEAELIEEFVHQSYVSIGKASKNLRPLSKLLTMLEMWMDLLQALALFNYNLRPGGSTPSVQSALAQIARLFDLNELMYVPNYRHLANHSSRSPSPVSEPILKKSEMFLFEDLNAGGDGFGKVYKVFHIISSLI